MNFIKWACFLAAVPVAVSFGDISTAATLKSIATKEGHVLISISGEIVEGDADALKATIKGANDAGKFVSGIRLNSIGGNLLEGVKLSETVKFAKMATNVAQGATCASACFLIFAAGDTKFANYTAQVGVHGASDQTGAETIQSGAATVSMARVAKELGVPAAIIGRMVVTPPSEMVWLSPSELQSMGVTMVGKPSQLAAPPQAKNIQQLPSGDPTSITPNAKASKPPTWNELVDAVTAMSASQNNGRPRYFRSCQPELKVCNTGIAYRDNKGTDMALKVVKDMKEAILSREICSFNVQGDIRVCFDWDKVSTHRDMKDNKGDWYKVADE
ncbi:hypothetical protein [Bradyrhizobium sp. LA2.1]|uniref:COG3904 family protein n=1 Tax=Bradyrhizobium sp. LA2.1 TaxID=3156376 RepID=UPI00339995A7